MVSDEALRCCDYRVQVGAHDPEGSVTVSARSEGTANRLAEVEDQSNTI